MLQFINNKNEKAVPFYKGKALCSFQRPLSEAQNWLKNYDLKGCSEVCIVGVGGGYHIKYLLLRNPSIKVTVVDFNLDLIESFLSEFKSSRVEFIHLDHLRESGMQSFKNLQKFLYEKTPVLMPFRPGWQGREELFGKLMLKMTQREAQVLKEQWQDLDQDLNLKWSLLEEERNFLTLKNLINATDSLRSFDEKVLFLFNEIIK